MKNSKRSREQASSTQKIEEKLVLEEKKSLESQPIQVSENSQTGDKSQEFSQIIDESKKVLSDEPKKTRGPYKKKTGQASSEGVAQSTANPSTNISSQNAAGSSMAPEIAMGISFISYQISEAKKIEAYKITKDEALPFSVAIDNALKVYIPDFNNMDPKKAALFSLITTGALLFGTKYLAGLEEQKKKKPEPKIEIKPENKDDLLPDFSNFEKINATEAFSKRTM